MADPNFSWVVNLKEFAHPVVETFSSVGTVGPSFFLAIAMFGFVLQISSLIVEKELKLRQVLNILFYANSLSHLNLHLKFIYLFLLAGDGNDGPL